MLVELFSGDLTQSIGWVDVPGDADGLPKILVVTPNPVLPTRYFLRRDGAYREITDRVLSLGNAPIVKKPKT